MVESGAGAPGAQGAREGTAGWAGLLERAHLTVMGAGAVGVIVLGWLAARVVGARTLYLMVYAAAAMVGLGWLASRRKLGLDVVRSEVPARSREGQTVSVELTLSARRRVSTIVLEEALPEAMGKTVHLPVASLRAGEELRHRYTFTPRRRGVYNIGPVVARWSDPFGFTTHRQVLLEEAEIIVHPTTETVHDRVLTRMWEDPPIRPPVSKPWPVGFEFYGMRDYVPGDDLRRVVWTAYAKTGRLLVRESEQGITDRIVVVVDTDREWHSPGPVSDTFETAVRVAASVGVRHLADGFAVTLLTNEGTVANSLRGSAAKLTYLDALARLGPGAKRLDTMAGALLDQARSRPHFVVVTPHLGADAAGQLKLVVDRGVSVVVAQLDWEESDPLSLARAAALGCQVVQVPAGVSLEGVFAQQVRVGSRT
jgi:uncharacterized protein (DUF58 family)